MDTFDPKIPSEIAGGSSPLSTIASGLQISSHLPRMAKQADKFAVVRSMTTKTGDHAGGNYLMHTGFSRQQIEIGQKNLHFVEVTNGLSEGDRIALSYRELI